jgi:hypothetical protein
VPTFERLTADDRRRIGRKGGHARWSGVKKAAAPSGTYRARKLAGQCVQCGQPAELRDPDAPAPAEPSGPGLNGLAVAVWRQLQGGVKSTRELSAALVGSTTRSATAKVSRALIVLRARGWAKRSGALQRAVWGGAETVVWAAMSPEPERQTLCARCVAFRARRREQIAAEQAAERVAAAARAVHQPYRKTVVTHEHGKVYEFESIWDGRSSIVDAVRPSEER